ncbi:Crp/Fnr family transcriptional regulator [Sunxiuqinia elliptica]|uniref:CRP-like cAMP-binding protein n=1 Tax=Sunxiuqinia elliptica TaxID=655355 RepID=A0A1I2KRN5_9BACT|nr:Crp/Fnr family transcriptional regulator [Sunxiuqinia elliptica]TDN97737.1 CRP-like cAMP-binding protein [Sunxiuqinia elliptica]TDO55815.1 CRP-like cAMP-binding protein [Sunxiuqinia elliptica]SFF69684.1 cAMP-binding domain of CRP or a regulatory subunit of cAMP-dependent protein kinases [Sunxiuqinia elliptica]
MNKLIAHLEKYYQIRIAKDFVVEDYFFIEQYKKKDFLVKENTNSKFFYLVLDGYIRSYHLSEHGEEITTELYREGDLAASMYSLLKSEKAYENIQCITDTIVCKISEESFERLCLQNIQWFQLGMKFLKKDILSKEERLLGFAKLSAKERYQKLLNEKPDIVQNVPVIYLASYLGIKPESLSRLRNQLGIS